MTGRTCEQQLGVQGLRAGEAVGLGGVNGL